MNKKPNEPMKPAQISLRQKAQARQRLRARVWLALVALCALIWLAIIGLVLHLTSGAATIGRHGQPAHFRPHFPECAATPGQAARYGHSVIMGGHLQPYDPTANIGHSVITSGHSCTYCS